MLLFVMHLSLDTININDVLPSTTAVHHSLMRQRPITTQTTFHTSIKGTPFACRPKRRQWKECLTLPFHLFTFVKADFNRKKPFQPFFGSARNICQVFSEIEMMEESRHGSNLHHQPSQPKSFLSISLFSLPF